MVDIQKQTQTPKTDWKIVIANPDDFMAWGVDDKGEYHWEYERYGINIEEIFVDANTGEICKGAKVYE